VPEFTKYPGQLVMIKSKSVALVEVIRVGSLMTCDKLLHYIHRYSKEQKSSLSNGFSTL
jgi:hypothetical protein